MQEIATTELLDILNNIKTDQMDSYIAQYGSLKVNTNIFSEYVAEHDISVSSIVKRCEGYISKSYIYDILGGIKKNPSRDIILTLCIAAKMNRKMVRRVLENYHHRDLYPKDTRDIIIATHINNKEFDINIINDALFEYQLPLLNDQRT